MTSLQQNTFIEFYLFNSNVFQSSKSQFQRMQENFIQKLKSNRVKIQIFKQTQRAYQQKINSRLSKKQRQKMKKKMKRKIKKKRSKKKRKKQEKKRERKNCEIKKRKSKSNEIKNKKSKMNWKSECQRQSMSIKRD